MEEKNLTIEERMLEKVKRNKKRKRNRKIVKGVLLLSVLSLFAFYLISDMSKVRYLKVMNNTLYTDTEILEKAGLNYQSNYVLTIRFWINHLLKKDPLIKNAKMDKDFEGGFTIYIDEEKVIGYLADAEDILLVQGKGSLTVLNVDREKLPRLVDFNDEQLKLLDAAFQDVNPEIFTMISEMMPHEETYNPNMVKMIMNDGNRITTSYEGVYLINQYKKILPQLEGTHVCLYMDAYSKNIIKQAGECK